MRTSTQPWTPLSVTSNFDWLPPCSWSRINFGFWTIKLQTKICMHAWYASGFFILGFAVVWSFKISWAMWRSLQHCESLWLFCVDFKIIYTIILFIALSVSISIVKTKGQSPHDHTNEGTGQHRLETESFCLRLLHLADYFCEVHVILFLWFC